MGGEGGGAFVMKYLAFGGGGGICYEIPSIWGGGG